jgi:3-oxoacyl-[acyl-carrier protein] reductase
MNELDGRTAVITGGGQGIGAAIATELVESGARVAILDLQSKPAESLVASLNAGRPAPVALSVAGSVIDPAAITAAFDEVADSFGAAPDLLVNNAGAGTFSLIVDTDESAWDTTVDVCLKGTFLVGREFARRLIPTGRPGAVVNVSSINWTSASEGIASYSAAKAGVVQLAKTMALEWAPHDIRVNCVAPGSVDTPMLANMLTDTMRGEFLARTPLRRLGRPDDIAAVVAFLLSDAARWITGAVIPVDGGQHLRLLQSYWHVLQEDRPADARP